ncbi:glycosyltransferase family 4 protein [Prosthecobacter sp.]|uniref:glycosyltransferase family 4 protein n=1 Tax=Prosthecobacter sp. TaxID=1965333 RepID=UPI0025DA82CD|nr:glycosyltransferase family 4 protein [Prosthecobacter sp.]
MGITQRGIESFFREAFDGLKQVPEMDMLLLKGGGQETHDEKVVACFAKTSSLASVIGKAVSRSSYVVEQWSSFPGVVRWIRKFRPHVVFYSDANLGFLLYRFRKWIGVPFKLLFSNGGPCHPPFDRYDFVHQVAPLYLEEALAAGEPAEKHFLVPYGIQVPSEPPMTDEPAKRGRRATLGLPQNRPVVLSVGWIARRHKRMDYVIEEVAKMSGPRPFLQLLGAIDEDSREVIELGNRLLGAENFSARSVKYEEVAGYYQAADIFVLGSLAEGFGRVYLEALMRGLPTVGHRHPVIEYVLGDVGLLADLSAPGNLAAVLTQALGDPEAASDGMRVRRRESIRSRFSWGVLRAEYMAMFQACHDAPFPALRSV